jgi:hypothetical protein
MTDDYIEQLLETIEALDAEVTKLREEKLAAYNKTSEYLIALAEIQDILWERKGEVR